MQSEKDSENDAKEPTPPPTLEDYTEAAYPNAIEEQVLHYWNLPPSLLFWHLKLSEIVVLY